VSAFGPSILPIPWSGVFGLKDATEQGPVDGPSLDGFGTVGAVAVDAFLADMQLPASEIGRCGFHGFGVYHYKDCNSDLTSFQNSSASSFCASYQYW
jgi:hypothetical protein